MCQINAGESSKSRRSGKITGTFPNLLPKASNSAQNPQISLLGRELTGKHVEYLAEPASTLNNSTFSPGFKKLTGNCPHRDHFRDRLRGRSQSTLWFSGT